MVFNLLEKSKYLPIGYQKNKKNINALVITTNFIRIDNNDTMFGQILKVMGMNVWATRDHLVMFT